MGWELGWDHEHKRDIGYGVPAICDHPNCNEEIDRGLSYICGGDVSGGSEGCGLFFCSEHLWLVQGHPQLCERCVAVVDGAEDIYAFEPKPDIEKWVRHKATDPSWEEWRKEKLESIQND